MKRKSNQESIGEVLDKFLKIYRLEDKFMELDAIAAWEELMGKAISKRTENIFIKDKKLFIKLHSSVPKEELKYQQEQMVKAINEKVGKEIINGIYFQ